MPLFTLWRDGTLATIVYTAVHCTIGDIGIAIGSICITKTLGLGRKLLAIAS